MGSAPTPSIIDQQGINSFRVASVQYSWLKKTGSRTCIVFMSGWGTDPTPFSSIVPNDVDCLMVFDYRELAPLDHAYLTPYETLHLLTWSMGVWVAGHLLKEEQELFETRTAIAGTLNPIDDQEGIPVTGYANMVKSFNENFLLDFQNSMFDEQHQREQFLRLKPKRELKEIHEELKCFQNHCQQHGRAEDIYTHKIITTRDRVFPFKNQARCWGKQNTTTIKQPHFPFYSFQTLKDILPIV